MEHTCNNCTIEECPHYSGQKECNEWTHNFVEDCINNLSSKERSLIEESQFQQNPLKKLNYKE